MQRDVVRSETGHARRCELDRERETVDPPTDLCTCAHGALGVERAMRPHAGALSKQLHGRLGGERRESERGFTLDPERLSARRENSKPRKARRQCVDEIGDRREDVLAVVDDEQDIAVGQPTGECVRVGLTTRLRQFQPPRRAR